MRFDYEPLNHVTWHVHWKDGTPTSPQGQQFKRVLDHIVGRLNDQAARATASAITSAPLLAKPSRRRARRGRWRIIRKAR